MALWVGIFAAGQILHYLNNTKHDSLSHVNTISRLDENNYVLVDKYSLKNLELFSPISVEGTCLVDIIDSATSPMGKRMLRRWLALPLRDKSRIEARYDVVDFFRSEAELRGEVLDNLQRVGDAERIIAKIAALRAMPRDLVQLSHSIGSMHNVKKLTAEVECAALSTLGGGIEELGEVQSRIGTTLLPEPAAAVGKGAVVAAGVSDELDELRQISSQGKAYLEAIVTREIERTGITSLKIGHNNVFGYYIEVRNAHKDKVPAEWIRKQTLVNAERYITEELKEYEQKIMGAEVRIVDIENRIYGELVDWLQQWVAPLKKTTVMVAQIDVLLSFAITSLTNNYCRPMLGESGKIEIKGLRHPVIEKRLPASEGYISSDVAMNENDTQIILLSGPNMSGKSALLRSVAIATLMAQCGSFVAATGAELMLCDRIFTRVGASDNISSGESTFMVEMLETANILNNLSDNSLVILDEIGRGTSTYDGISIAWAIVEHIHKTSAAKVLFATHYHELGEMYKSFERIKNFHIAVKEIDGKIIFLRKLVEGAVEHSFGVHVAAMAGMPRSVVQRAQTILSELERQRSTDIKDVGSNRAKNKKALQEVGAQGAAAPVQLSFFNMDDPSLSAVAAQIRDIDINCLTPLEALNKLSEIKKIISGRE